MWSHFTPPLDECMFGFPCAIRAQTIRAVLLASATETRRAGFFSSMTLTQAVTGVSRRLEWRMTGPKAR